MNRSIDSCLITGGLVFDSRIKKLSRNDVLVEAGNVVAVGKNMAGADGVLRLNAAGKLVLPGLIDFHLHCFHAGQLLSINADELAPHAGTTTFVDAGSCGAINFSAFREFVIGAARANILAFLNISAVGQHALGIRGINTTEYADERFLHVDSAVETIEKNRQHIVGVKVRMCPGNKSLKPLEAACQAAALTNMPVMVHVDENTVPLRTVLEHLRAGDIVTHMYHGGKDTILGNDGQVRADVIEARSKGVLFDVGLDRMHSNFTVIQAALAQGFYPDFISTDLTTCNRHIVRDMPTTISKFVALGLSLEEALYRSTLSPAGKLGRHQVGGEIRPGAVADLGIFELEQGEFRYQDTSGNSVVGNCHLTAVTTLIKGQVATKTDIQQNNPSFLIG